MHAFMNSLPFLFKKTEGRARTYMYTLWDVYRSYFYNHVVQHEHDERAVYQATMAQ